jgi:succinoglycan biosynthesis protein ExoU
MLVTMAKEDAVPGDICVIVAAKNAAATIGLAVRSALAEEEVGRVIVVDDGSSDGTGDAAVTAGSGDGRLEIIRLDHNLGPSAARNRAIAASREPLIAVLDADDAFLPGRFKRLLQLTDWDMAADNIAFVRQLGQAERIGTRNDVFDLDLVGFVRGNLTRRGVQRGEYGFLKVVLRRDFLDRHGLRYDETLRLGEDYDLYARALAAGARFRVSRTCGYEALLRSDSLSARHATPDLERFADVDLRLLAQPGLTAEAVTALELHLAETRQKHLLRRFLDERRQDGPIAALLRLALQPAAWGAVVGGVLTDKLAPLGRLGQASEPEHAVRYLLPDGRP